MIVVDTNVISALTRNHPDKRVLHWIANGDPRDLYLCDMTIMELEFGAERYWIKHGSSKYRRFVAEFIEVEFRDNILGHDRRAFARAGRIRAQCEMDGRMLSPQDAMIAAICLQHGATLATRNTKDFEGLDLALVNPFEGA
jgi:toxin FitB